MKNVAIVRVGSDERPATPDDIKDVTDQLKKFQEEGAMKEYNVFVTHHAFSMTVFDKDGQVSYI